MIPAGYLANQGEMSLTLVILVGIFGSLAGAILTTFWLKNLVEHFFLSMETSIIDEKSLNRLESFFKTHGEISTFAGRLIPGIRQYISLPAGLANMNIIKFSIYTSLGAGIWVTILALLGYFIGENEALIKEYLSHHYSGNIGYFSYYWCYLL